MACGDFLSSQIDSAGSGRADNYPSVAQIIAHLRRAQQVALQSVAVGHHPFGCLLVGPDNQTVLFEQGNIDTVNHAELTLARAVSGKFSPQFLFQCTLYTTVEPCCMCSGALYWANIGRLAYAISESQLLAATGNHEQNPTLNVPCRYIFQHGQKEIKVWGPFSELENEILSLHLDYWK